MLLWIIFTGGRSIISIFGYAAACGIVMGIVVFVISMGLKKFLRYGENL